MKIGLMVAGIVGGLALQVAWPEPGTTTLTLVQDGAALAPIVAGSLDEPVARLRTFIAQASGAEMPVVPAAPGQKGLHIGLRADFPWQQFAENDDLGPEGFLIQTAGDNLFLLADHPAGVEHAVTTFQRKLGHRRFFPGSVWEVIPHLPTIAGYWQTVSRPAYRSQRRLWYGFGAYGPARNDLAAWNRANRMGGPEPVSIGHTWYGIARTEENLAAHPEWFALVERDGTMQRRLSKPCFSHPEVVEQIIQHTLNAARGGARSVSLSPPDGLGYCECDLCRAVFQGGEPQRAHGTIFAVRPDGVQVNIISETLFAAVNRAAETVAAGFPDFIIGCYAYSAYSHPPSFPLHPNVYIQTTTAYRRTPLSLQEQLEQWGQRANQVGIREYWSVYQWDWDNPDPGKMRPERLVRDIRFFHENNVIAMNAEASNNWGPRGLGYYIAAQLLWDVNADVPALIEDFYRQAFGAAAPAMERYYARWYGPSVVSGLDPRSINIAGGTETETAIAETDETGDSGPVYSHRNHEGTRQTLVDAFADLDDAVRLTANDPAARARVDHLRMYAVYLVLRWKVWTAAAAGDETAVVNAVRDETQFGGRLAHTHMIHARPLLGKAFHRRFRAQMPLLENIPEAREWHSGWRVVGTVPDADEFDTLWSEARTTLGIVDQ